MKRLLSSYPWKFENRVNSFAIMDSHGVDIHYTCKVNNLSYIHEDTIKRNTKCMSKAPDMLELLIEAKEELKQLHDYYYEDCKEGCPSLVTVKKIESLVDELYKDDLVAVDDTDREVLEAMVLEKLHKEVADEDDLIPIAKLLHTVPNHLLTHYIEVL